ncbi:NADH dehydrogenase I subunit K [Candidatus Kinetoplastibacterium blastocrithidii TCC012E]|uniref:NADH-quinone oxidoreductase subunit K n=1 Tax=Candidatus Kinetoplastidibacterium blastocrithidiae TCC012E TaxID=1208922 RepID=M1LWM0_9PROT|nr:NADH-quinone oxidoreductase subunit NuoK [Candidatus Kinetoplastibacterium blastocrithidii]AGF49922.1 NADH dehydrogenase I subunit K [Candidatus Kinetoplastibacterium blastocrithidii TCC012E]
MIAISHCLILSSCIFAIGILGIFVNRHNIIVMLMSIELILLSSNLNFVIFSEWNQNISGQVFVFFVMTVAAAESAIGLAILVLLFRNLDAMNVNKISQLKG